MWCLRTMYTLYMLFEKLLSDCVKLTQTPSESAFCTSYRPLLTDPDSQVYSTKCHVIIPYHCNAQPVHISGTGRRHTTRANIVSWVGRRKVCPLRLDSQCIDRLQGKKGRNVLLRIINTLSLWLTPFVHSLSRCMKEQ